MGKPTFNHRGGGHSGANPDGLDQREPARRGAGDRPGPIASPHRQQEDRRLLTSTLHPPVPIVPRPDTVLDLRGQPGIPGREFRQLVPRAENPLLKGTNRKEPACHPLERLAHVERRALHRRQRNRLELHAHAKKGFPQEPCPIPAQPDLLERTGDLLGLHNHALNPGHRPRLGHPVLAFGQLLLKLILDGSGEVLRLLEHIVPRIHHHVGHLGPLPAA